MIPIELLIAFVVASAALIAVPGPNVALIVSHSVTHGTRYGLLTVAATTATQIFPLLLVTFGMSAVLAFIADWFEWLRWAGVAYLIVLGVTTWRRAAGQRIEQPANVRIGRTVFVRGVLVAITNPKTLLFYGALLPQFVSPDKPALQQLVILSTTFLVIALVGDSLWAIFAGKAHRLLTRTAGTRNRIMGALLITAGFGMALARRS